MACQYDKLNYIPQHGNQPFNYPDAYLDAPNSKHSPEVTGNIINKIFQATRDELLQQYPTSDALKNTYPYPKLIISEDKRRTGYNSSIYNYNIAHDILVYNNDPSCTIQFNIRNLNDATGLQFGYARNIDLDSELKRINHLTDKCFYDNYKFHPTEAPAGNGLYCNKNVLVKDYTPVGKPVCLATNTQKSVITPAQMQQPSNETQYYSDNIVNYGLYKNPQAPNENNVCPSQNIKMPAKCLPNWDVFPVSNDKLSGDAQCLLNYKMSIAGNIPQHYMFNGDIYNQSKKYNVGYPQQRLFNNFTKRSTLPNFHNTFDINPRYLS